MLVVTVPNGGLGWVKLLTVPFNAVPKNTAPPSLICCPVKPAIPQVKVGSVVPACDIIFSQYIEAPALSYPTGTNNLKNRVTFCAVEPALADTVSGFNKVPPSVNYTPWITADEFGLVIVPSWAIEPPCKAITGTVQLKVIPVAFTVIDISCTASQVVG